MHFGKAWRATAGLCHAFLALIIQQSLLNSAILLGNDQEALKLQDWILMDWTTKDYSLHQRSLYVFDINMKLLTVKLYSLFYCLLLLVVYKISKAITKQSPSAN